MWEKIDDTTERLKVHNGWLVHRRVTEKELMHEGDYRNKEVRQFRTTASMVFVVDQLHQWKI